MAIEFRAVGMCECGQATGMACERERFEGLDTVVEWVPVSERRIRLAAGRSVRGGGIPLRVTWECFVLVDTAMELAALTETAEG